MRIQRDCGLSTLDLDLMNTVGCCPVLLEQITVMQLAQPLQHHRWDEAELFIQKPRAGILNSDSEGGWFQGGESFWFTPGSLS